MTDTTPDTAPATGHAHGYKLADEEMERLERKRASGDVLDPIALDDPSGLAVERVVARVGVVVVLILVMGILIAQVACKNIQLWGIPSFASGVSQQTVEKALDSGVTWAGEIVRFPDLVSADLDEANGLVEITVKGSPRHNAEQLAEIATEQAFALAMNLFSDASISQVSYTVTVGDAEDADGVPGTAVTVLWQRDPVNGALTSTLTGFSPVMLDSDHTESE